MIHCSWDTYYRSFDTGHACIFCLEWWICLFFIQQWISHTLLLSILSLCFKTIIPQQHLVNSAYVIYHWQVMDDNIIRHDAILFLCTFVIYSGDHFNWLRKRWFLPPIGKCIANTSNYMPLYIMARLQHSCHIDCTSATFWEVFRMRREYHQTRGNIVIGEGDTSRVQWECVATRLHMPSESRYDDDASLCFPVAHESLGVTHT